LKFHLVAILKRNKIKVCYLAKIFCFYVNLLIVLILCANFLICHRMLILIFHYYFFPLKFSWKGNLLVVERFFSCFLFYPLIISLIDFIFSSIFYYEPIFFLVHIFSNNSRLSWLNGLHKLFKVGNDV